MAIGERVRRLTGRMGGLAIAAAIVSPLLLIAVSWVLPQAAAAPGFRDDQLQRLEQLAFAGTNYLPSPLTPLFPALLWIAAMAALCGGLVMLARALEGRGWPWAVFLLLGGVAVTLLLGTQLRDDRWIGPRIERVFVRSVAVAGAGPDEVLGIVVGASGGAGEVRRDRGALRVLGLPRAGRYEGRMSLLAPGSDKGVAEVAVTVSDWWPYAFATIALGVVIGYLVIEYYAQRRRAAELRARAARLWLQAIEDDSRFQQAHAGARHAGFGIVGLLRDWLARVERDLQRDEFDVANLRLDRAESYIGAFARFLVTMVALDEAQATLWEELRRGPFALASRADAQIFRDIDVVLSGQPLAFPPDGRESEEGTELDEWRERADTANEWIVRLRAIVATIAQLTREAENALLPDLALRLRHLGHTAVAATTMAEAEAATERALTEYSRLAPDVVGSLAPVAEIAEDLFPDIADPLEEYIRVIRPLVALECKTFSLDSGATERGDCLGDPDDPILLQFHANRALPAPPPGVEGWRWDFGDGVLSPFWTPSEDLRAAETRHRFTRGGAYTVTVTLTLTGRRRPVVQRQIVVCPGGRSGQRLATSRLTDRQVTVLTGLLAVGSGFATLYSPNATWGSPGDYLAAFLWGSVVSEGLKYASGLLGHIRGQA